MKVFRVISFKRRVRAHDDFLSRFYDLVVFATS